MFHPRFGINIEISLSLAFSFFLSVAFSLARARSLSLDVNYLLILIIVVRLESSEQFKKAPPVCNLGGGDANQRDRGVLSCSLS